MASTSSNPSQWKYDVFISFRGADVRDGFLSHLFEALCKNQIITFKDENLERGEIIEPALLQRIEESHVSIVIFSENYVYSSWCLDELVKIMDCKKLKGQIVLPVFYRIDPTDVQELTGSYGDALAKHAEEFQDKAERWSLALTETAVMSGFVSQNLESEAKLIDKIVKHILERVNMAFSSDPCDDGLVGIKSRLGHVEQLLDLEAMDVRFLGIWGMGGIGKTTLARKVFDQFSSHFQGQCFISNVREELKHCTEGELQKKILYKLLEKENLNVGMPIMSSSSIRKWIMRKKVLIVLDDVWDLDVVEFFIGKQDIYARGSRIIITSRDKQILKNTCDKIYQVKELNEDDSLQLFNLHAFKQNSLTEAFMEAARKAVVYAQGNPLALRVLGFNLYCKSVDKWEDLLKKLKNTPDSKIRKILRTSYDELDENEQEIFLDIACFFCSEDKENVESILESCYGRFARIGISCLLDKCLINVSNNKLEMHDLLRQMGKEIVYKEYVKNPGKRSRLWNPHDIHHVLSKDMGKLSVESMSLNITRIGFIELGPTIFVKMSNLRFMKFYTSYYHEDSPYPHKRIQGNVHLPKGLSFLPNELRYLHWYNYPSKSLPFSFFPDKLVQLHLVCSHVQQLCNEHQCLENLKVLDLSYSTNLIVIPELSKLPKLEVLRLRGCISLVEIRSSVRYDNKLSHLDLGKCKNLCNFPKFIEFINLGFLSLEDCSKLRDFPKVPRNTRHLNLSGTTILDIPPSMGHQFFLTELLLKSCTGLESLPSGVVELRCLKKLDLGGCSKLKELPNVPCNLKDLILKGTAIQEVPSSIGHCSQLVTLNLGSCIRLESVPSSIGELKFLKILSLSGCSKLKRLPDEICNLKALRHFSIDECRNLNELPENLGNLESLWGLWAFQSGLKKLPPSLNFLRRLELLDCNSCTGLMLPPLTGPVRLRHLYTGGCGMTEIFTCTGSLVSLKTLNLSANLLEKLPPSIDSLVSLQELYLGGNLLKELPTSIGSLVSLKELYLGRNLLKELPTSIGSLVSLETLSLGGNLLKELPTSIGSLVSLERLYLGGNLLETLPTSVEQLSKLRYLDMMNCMRLKCLPKLPSSLGSLKVEGCTSLESMPAAWHTKGNVYNCISHVDDSDCVNLDVIICKNIIKKMLVGIEYLFRQPKFEDFHK